MSGALQLFDVEPAERDSLAITDLTRSRSWAELETNIHRLALFFSVECNLSPGDHIALHIGNRVEFVEAMLAGIMSGLWVTPVNTHLAEPEGRYIVDNCNARLLLFDEEHQTLVTGSPIPTLQIDTLLAQTINRFSDDEIRGNVHRESPSGGTMLYTSGTTGKPKGVMRSKPARLGDALDKMKAGAKALGLTGGGPHLVTGPLYHAAPMLFAIYDLLNGAPMIIMARWGERQFLQLVREYGVTTTHLVPTMMVRLLNLRNGVESGSEPVTVANSLSLVLHGAAPISRHTKTAMLDWWGDILVEYWGGSEAGVTTLINSREWRTKPGSVGKPLPHFSVFVGDANGNPMNEAEGDLYCRHRDLPQVFSYYRDAEKTGKAHPQPHVFSIGDRGYVDDDGYVFLNGRQSNMIISGGVNIYPTEIEHALIQHPVVDDCAVLGVPDDEWGERVYAVVQLSSDSPLADKVHQTLEDFLTPRLARYKIPGKFVIVNKIPRMETGKVKQADLKRLVL